MPDLIEPRSDDMGSLPQAATLRWGFEETGGDKGRFWWDRVAGHIRPVAGFILSLTFQLGAI